MEQYQKLAQEAYGDDAPKFIEISFYAKMAIHLKRVLNQARLETEYYDTMVQHLEKEVELNGLSAPIENTITGIHQIDAQEQQQAPTPPKPAGPCYGCGHSGHVIKNCRKPAGEARNRGNRVPNKIANLCETCGKKTLRRQSGKNGDCNKSVVVLCGFLNCIITHAFQELTKVE